MVSKKSKPIKKRRHESRHTEHKQVSHEVRTVQKETNIWMIAAIILAIALIASIMTRGFQPVSLNNVEESINKLMLKESSQEVKSYLQNALAELQSAKEAIAKQDRVEFSGEKVKLDFYVMSQCPYGTQVEDAVKPALDKLGDAVEFNLNFILTELEDGTFRSLHGESETQGDIVQLCAAKYNPDKYMDMVVCMNENSRSIPYNWEKCAKDNGLNVNDIKKCFEGEEGENLLRESIKKTNQAGARGSPTMFINGKPYNGGRDTLSFLRALCNELENHPECENLPACSTDADCNEKEGMIGKCVDANTDQARCEYVEPQPINMILINDKKCKECQQFRGLVDQLRQIFKGLEITEYDFENEKGRALYDELKLSALPAFLFDETVKEGEGYPNVQRYLLQIGDYYSLRVGASYDPMAEICDNDIDDRDHDGLVDCEDDECSSQWQCMDKKDVPEVELFVMSHCPYGTQMEKGILPVVELLGDKIDFKIRFVYYAMHGEKEVNEEARQYCIQKEQKDKFISYF